MVEYQLGVDLGTTYTAAAVRHDGVSEIVTLGTRSATMPTIVVAAPDGTLLVGEAAERRAVELPERTARQVKRRLGDTAPIILGGTPYSPQALLAAVLADVVARVSEEQGGPPERVTITHPANWGPYKRELVRQIAELAGLEAGMVSTITEPAAAALHYASQAQLEPGATVAVYDLGGGTFDAAVVRVDVGGAEVLGEPTGIEHLGGIDLDAAVFDHVTRELGPRAEPLLDGDASDGPLLARLRDECTRAKEALSSDTDATIGVALPDGYADLRINRSEFEALVRPALLPTVTALQRAIASAEVTADDLDGVLLVGGSSRIPLVSELVAGALSRPVLLDTHPKHAVALGAVAHASGAEVGAAVAVIGGEIDLAVVGLRRARHRALLAVAVILLVVGALVGGLLLAGDNNPELIESASDENESTTTDDDGDTTTSESTSSTVLGETTTSVVFLPNGGTSIVFGPAIAAGGGDEGTGTTAAPAETTAPTAAPIVFTTPSAVRNASSSYVQITEFFPDNISKTVRIQLSWQPPTNLGGGLSGYRIVGTPLFEGATPFGQVIDFTVGSSQLSTEVDVTVTQTSNQGLSIGGYVRWEIFAVNGAGTAGAPTRPSFVVPNLVGMNRLHHFRVIWSIGGSVGTFTNGSCDPALVCAQDPTSGSLASSQQVNFSVNGS